MIATKWKLTHCCFNVLCILATISLVFWCLYEYSKNEDICEILFKRFHEDEESLYPDLTFCVADQFDEMKLKSYNENFTSLGYRNFLAKGDPWDDRYLKVNFFDVTMKLEDHLIETCLRGADPTSVCEKLETIKTSSMFGEKCYTFHFPKGKPMAFAFIKINTSIFDNGIRPKRWDFKIMFSFMNQIYASFAAYFAEWPERSVLDGNAPYNMLFLLKQMEILRYRKKSNDVCDDSNDYDRRIKENMIKKIGCHPLYWTFDNASTPICSKREDFERFNVEHFDKATRYRHNGTYLHPCKEFQKFQIEYRDVNDYFAGQALNMSEDSNSNKTGDKNWFQIEYQVRVQKFKEIVQIRAYTLQSLVGNVGGYIGLLLGYAILNVPSLLWEAWSYFKNYPWLSSSKYRKSARPNTIGVLEYGTMDVRTLNVANLLSDGQRDHFTELAKLVLRTETANKKLKEKLDKVETRLNYVVIRPLSGLMTSHEFLKKYV